MPRIAFGALMLDAHPLAVGEGVQGLLRAQNAIPYGGQYRGFRLPVGITASGTNHIDATPRGTGFGTKSSGAPYHFVGTSAKLFELQSTGFVDVSPGGGFSLGATDIWSFTQFDDFVIAAGGLGQKVQAFLMGTSTVFDDIDDAGTFGGSGTAPAARYVWVLNDQVFSGYLSTDPAAIHFSAKGNANAWPTPGSAPAIANFSDLRGLPGGGTRIQAIRGTGEVGGIFKDKSLWRADFVGGDVAWQFHMVVPDTGLKIPELAVPFGNVLLFYSEKGWKLWSYGGETVDVGDGVIDRFFRDDLDTSAPQKVSWTVSGDESFCLIRYVGRGNVGGKPNRTLLFHYNSKQFATVEDGEIEWVTNAFQPTTTPTIDTMSSPMIGLPGSPDDPTAPTSVHLGGYAQSDHSLKLFTGACMEMTIYTGEYAHAADGRATVDVVRPMIDVDEAHAARVSVGARSRRNEAPIFTAELQQANDGECYPRIDGRYIQYRFRVPEGADDIQAMGAEFECTIDGSTR